MSADFIRENLISQVNELEALQSVYPEELTISDHGILADINCFIKSSGNDFQPQRLEYSVTICVNNDSLELLVSLPSNYPSVKPEIYVRSSSMNRNQQLILNEALTSILQQQEKGEACIYTLISWLQDNAENFLDSKDYNDVASSSNKEECEIEKLERSREAQQTTFVRYWIYSHHIYNKFKRKEILDLARNNSVTGFCLPGKPGIICYEGEVRDCEYCWQKIKTMNWHKIVVKFIEKQENSFVEDQRIFKDIQELSFPSFEKHNDMGLLLKFLTERKLQYAFKELFGMEGKLSELSES